MTLVIAGERSGVGKTTVTLALLAALARCHPGQVQTFKVGPDYIDPMFHQFVTGRPGRNLDPVLTSEAYVKWCFQKHSQTANYALIEGVMGLFDGATGAHDWASTAHIARLLNLPILLVVNCSSTSRSLAAIVHGYTSFDRRLKFAGVVLNRVASDRHLELLQAALAPLNIPILGVLRRQVEISIPDRHLGLIPTAELPQLHATIDRLAEIGAQNFDWSQLESLLTAAELSGLTDDPTAMATLPVERSPSAPPLRLGVARDRAFSFYYADNFDWLRAAGFELVEWSPLSDRTLPEQICGLYFGGGFPEVFAAELSENGAVRQAVQAAIAAGMPTYAECGGLMYLCTHLIDFEVHSYPMVGSLPAIAQMGARLTLGYRQATVQQATPLLTIGDVVWGHEFHHSRLDVHPEAPIFSLRNYDGTQSSTEGWRSPQLHASYLHLHFGDKLAMLARWRDRCGQYQQGCVERTHSR
ncbi:cobyrinate a,c-diamide synthase [bacterium]|nr:cobyrinate a,c-diamide synthase [bacterium]